MIEKNHIKIHIPTVILALIIFIFSIIPGSNIPDFKFSLQDKLAHFVIFFVFGLLLQRSFSNICVRKMNIYLIVFMVGTAYGGFNETIQLFVKGREADLRDLAADCVGIVSSQLFFYIIERFKKIS